MDSLLQACLFPSLAIEMQCSNGLIHRAKSKDCDLGESPCFSEMDKRRCHEEIDFNDMAAINPELLEFLPLHPYNLPLQENVTTQKQKRRSVNFKIPTPKEGLRSRSASTSTVSEIRITAQENDRWSCLGLQIFANGFQFPPAHLWQRMKCHWLWSASMWKSKSILFKGSLLQTLLIQWGGNSVLWRKWEEKKKSEEEEERRKSRMAREGGGEREEAAAAARIEGLELRNENKAISVVWQ